MILISLLLALLLERVVVKTPAWQGQYYASQYRQWLQSKDWVGPDTDALMVYLMPLVPAFIIAALIDLLTVGLLTLAAQTAILFIMIGCPMLRNTYKCYLQAANRGDIEACCLYTEKLGHCGASIEDDVCSAQAQGRSFGQHLLWLNYQHYAAVILWFIGFGAGGALFYVIAREAQQAWQDEDSERARAASRLMFALDFIPVRVTSLGLLLVGHFTRALPVWLTLLPQLSVSAPAVLAKVAAAAESFTPEDLAQGDATTEPKQLVKLAKRNIIFLMVVTAVLTLSGSLA